MKIHVVCGTIYYNYKLLSSQYSQKESSSVVHPVHVPFHFDASSLCQLSDYTYCD